MGKKCSGYVQSHPRFMEYGISTVSSYRSDSISYAHKFKNVRSVMRLRMIETRSCNISDLGSRNPSMIGYQASSLSTANLGLRKCRCASSIGSVS